MSALLDDLRPYDESVRSPHVHQQHSITEIGQWFAPDTANLFRDPRTYRKNFSSPIRRRVYEIPEVDVSTPFAEGASSSASSVSAFREHQAASQLLAEWHGQVVEIRDDSFTAQLRGRFGEGVAGSEDEAVIPIDDVREEDRELFQAGAFFSLCISYEVNAAGSKRRYTEVIFRRMPAFRWDELEAAAARAKEIVRGLRVE